MDKGYFQVYTGYGKGKTTAALGLALRAVGNGMRVYIGQFLKLPDTSEMKTLSERFPDVTIEQYGMGRTRIIGRDPDAADEQAAESGFAKAFAALHSREYDVVILDEINMAVWFGLISEAEAQVLINTRPDNVELVFTGRDAPQSFIDAADLVSEVREVKHYYHKGVLARRGIEY